MSKGIIYVTTTIVPGLIKIGKTKSDQFENRMYNLEHNGYSNVVGLKRYFAIEVEDYDEKEKLLQDIFSKSRLENTELFACDINLVVQLLSSFEGTQIYPKQISKEEVFIDATDKKNVYLIPDGTYYFNRTIKRWNDTAVTGVMEVKEHVFVVKKGSIICPLESAGLTQEVKTIRNSVKITANILKEDVVISSPSAAGGLLMGSSCNGWVYWKTEHGDPINVFRNKK